MQTIDAEARALQAREYFKSGYNCAQAVVMAYADLYGMEREAAAIISSGFGGGMGRLREVCGTCSGMFMVASLAIPANDPSDHEAKKRNYAMVQDLAADFRRDNGSIICRDLLGLQQNQDLPEPAVRTSEYYKKRPCAELVYHAAKLVGEKLNNLTEAQATEQPANIQR